MQIKMKYCLIAVFTVLVYRIVFCVSGYIRTVYYEKKYKAYLAGDGEVFTLYAASVQKLFKQAEIPAPLLPLCEPVGYGKIRTANVSVFENMANKRQDTVYHMANSFIRAKGYFRMCLLECISPLYWVQLVVFLPGKMLGYVGISSDKMISKFLQIAYWLLTPLFLCFRTQIYDFIIQLLQNV